MEIADIVFELTPVKNAAGTYQDAFRARFSLIRNRHEYRQTRKAEAFRFFAWSVSLSRRRYFTR